MPLISGATNFAPLDPILKLRERTGQPVHYISDALKEKFQHYVRVDETVRRELIQVGQLVQLHIEGKQIYTIDPFTYLPRAIPFERQDPDAIKATNLMQFYATNCISKWLLSNPNILVFPGSDTEESKGAASLADIIIEHYEQKFFTAWQSQQEALQALTFGTYISRLRHDPGIQGIIGLRQIVEDRSITLGEGAGRCECGYTGPEQEFNAMAEGPDGQPTQATQCPKCGSDAVLMTPAATGTVPTVTGTDRVEMGDLVLDCLPMPGCWWDIRHRIEDSSWMLNRKKTSMGEIRKLLGNLEIPEGQPYDIGLDVVDALSHSGQAMEGKSAHGWQRRRYQNEIVIDEMSLSADDIRDIPLRGDEKTISGQTLQGETLADAFPDGCVAVGINGMALLLGLYPEHHSKGVTSGVWHAKPLSGAGRGAVDGVEIQKRYNKFDSQIENYLDASGTPAVLYDDRMITPDGLQYLANPRANVPVDMTGVGANIKLSDAVMALSPSSPAGGLVQYALQHLNNMFQLSFHVTDFSSGLPGVDNKTATGAQIASALSNSIFAPVLQMKGQVRQEVAKKVISFYRDYFPLPRWFRGKHTQQQGVWLKGADLDADLAYETEKDSETPRNTFTKREDAQIFFTMLGGVQGWVQMKEAAPELAAEIASLFNIRLTSEKMDISGQRCQQRIDQAKQMLQMGLMDPMMMAGMLRPPVSISEPNHLEKSRWFSNYLDSDEALAPEMMPVRMFADLMAQQHLMFHGQQQMGIMAAMNPGAMMGMGPEGEQQSGPPNKKKSAV